MSIDLTQLQTAQSTQHPTSNAASTPWWKTNISLGGQKLNDKKKERFYKELHTLVGAGMNLKTALDMLIEEAGKKPTAALLLRLKKAVINGQSLSRAMQDTGRFSAYEYVSIRIGEESGRLVVVLEELGDFFGKKTQLKRQLVSALTYPGFVLIVAIGVVYFMLRFIVPMFSGVFARFGGDLPAITQTVIQFSEVFGQYAAPVFLGLVVGCLILYTQRKTVWFRSGATALLLRVPFFGRLVRKIFLARMCRSLYLLLAARTPLVEALNLVQQMIGLYPLEKSLVQIRDGVLEGRSLNACLADHRFFPKRMISLVKVGEEVSRLDQMFDRVANQYSEEVEHQTGLIGSVIEPIMIIFIAGFVGLILIAMYLPMFQLSNTIG